MYTSGRRIALALVALGLIGWTAGQSRASQLITFDDVSMTSGLIDSQWLRGIELGQIHVVNKNYLPGTGYENGVVSGDYAAFNGFAAPANLEISSASTFDLTSAYVPAAYNDRQIQVQGYNDADPVLTTSFIRSWNRARPC